MPPIEPYTQEYIAVAPVSSWQDPRIYSPPHGSKMLMLTEYGVAVLGSRWDDTFVAWAPLPSIPPEIKERLR